MIYTSNYARKSKEPNAFAISRKPPDWYQGQTLEFLAPTWEIIMAIKNGQIDEAEYTKQYIELLHERRITPKGLLDALPAECYLLCYEPPGDFCHRRVLAEWVYHHTGFWIPEWKNEKEQAKENQKMVVDSLLDF